MPDRMFVGIAQFVFLLRERRDPFTGGQVLDAISIYVPRREDDIRGAISTPPNWLFQFTSPQGGTTRGNQIALIVGVISIHVSTRGTTPRVHRYTQWAVYFNPRPHKGDDRREQIVKP